MIAMGGGIGQEGDDLMEEGDYDPYGEEEGEEDPSSPVASF
jgi:hypothetical protein